MDHVSVCICTFRRQEWLHRLLKCLGHQKTNDLFTFSIVVVDNDPAASAESVVNEIRPHVIQKITYCIEPHQNIAQVRNRAVENATGDWIAFIDDDEYPVDDWLLQLLLTAQKSGVAGVLGPVRPDFPEAAPGWAKKSGLYHRAEHKTGFILQWRECRTGNVLFRCGILPGDHPAFSLDFPNGGEDQDFFRRMMESGHQFIWCNEAVVYETVPPARWNKKVLIHRALLRGKNTIKHSDVTPMFLAKSVVAVIAYTLVLPVLALTGMHLFMRYLVKLCDHLGKLLAVIGINPVEQRLG
jgi:succinoglycan biosynthesis protein ExoM